MGYQLWTSPVTGYRRRGTRLEDFNSAFSEKIRVKAIFEPLRSCPEGAPSEQMSDLLEQLDFDVAGVRASADTPVIGLVFRKALEGGVIRDHMMDIREESIVSDSLGVNSLLNVLKESSFVFVRINGLIEGIVTRADLNKPIVRIYFFGLISLLEFHFGFWIAEKYSDESWRNIIGRERVAIAERTQDERRRRGQELQLRDCLQIGDKHKLIIQHDELRAALNLGSKRRADRLLGKAEHLRNSLAHSQYDLILGKSWNDLIEAVQTIEGAIIRSDELVEAYAKNSAIYDLGALW